MSRIEDHISSMGFTLKPKERTVYEWTAHLQQTVEDLTACNDTTGLPLIIAYLEDVLVKGRLLADIARTERLPITCTSGLCQLYWLHIIRQKLQETELPFKPEQLQLSNLWIEGKINLLKETCRAPQKFSERTIRFLSIWTEEAAKYQTMII